MNKIQNFNTKISELLRGNAPIDEWSQIITKYYLLGYINQLSAADNCKLDFILKCNDIKDALNSAFETIEEDNILLQQTFNHLNSDEKLSQEIIHQLISNMNISNLTKTEWTVAYENMMNKIIEAQGKGGEGVDIPECLNELAIKLLDTKEGSLYAGIAGINGTLIEGYKYSREYGKDLELYAQESMPKFYAIGKIRLFLNGIEKAECKCGDVLKNPLFKENDNELKRFDYVIMNYPFSLRLDDAEKIVEEDKFNRFVYGKPPRSNADMLFISHGIKSLKDKGKAVAITTGGTLFRSGAEAQIRENILASDLIEAVISLPSNLYRTTGIPVNIIIFNKNKEQGYKNKILFINAEAMYESIRRGQHTLAKEHIERIVDAYRGKKAIEEFSALVDVSELKETNLMPSRYVVKTELNIEPYGEVVFNKEKLKELEKCKTLGDISEFYRGINIVSDESEYKEGNYKVINLANVQEGKVNIEALSRYNIKNNARVESYLVQEGDIIISSRGVKGVSTKVCVIPKHEGKVLLSQNFIGIRVKQGISPEYIKEFLACPLGQFLIMNRQIGTSIITINPKDLKEVLVVLLPLEDQIKIINEHKVEEFRIKEEIETLQEKLKNNKQEMYNQMGIGDSFIIKGYI
ncbi:N-6 DNA methylase [Clostridium sp. FP2]|uniref:N-6 DNA methylase n=1 Tax=Clostridium sp. FP2 TaxID=2724481 RepID=UPI0013E99749|nr:N-6 DNA methylase [Clostridium sp. FP2]MBZ9623243.1 N-6 DNA methylase [Clostridium sp. FP2]